MNVIAQPANPDEIEVTLTITMPLSDWKRLDAQIDNSTSRGGYPAWTLLQTIRSIVQRVQHHFQADLVSPGQEDA